MQALSQLSYSPTKAARRYLRPPDLSTVANLGWNVMTGTFCAVAVA